MSIQSTQMNVLYPEQGESVVSFERRIAESRGETLVIFADLEPLMMRDKEARKRLLASCKKYSTRLRIASRNIAINRVARAKGIRVIDSVSDLQKLLKGNAALEDAVREFQPHIWRRQLRSRLQAMGLLSLPKLRIWILILVSASLFFFVFFRLLPSATIRVWPREEAISQTVNIFLAQSGAVASLPQRVRILELKPITVSAHHTITFDQISKEFIGTNAQLRLNVVNTADETYWLRGGSRVRNQAGMTFRIKDPIKVAAGQTVEVDAEAEAEDLYGEIIGSRGNVPPNLKWEFPGLSPAERLLVYAENITSGTGGTSEYRTVLSEKDLEIARLQLEQELLSIAKQLVDEERELYNSEHPNQQLEILYYDELTKYSYSDFILPRQFLGKPVSSIPIEGRISYTIYAYDTQEVLDMLSTELRTHVGEGRRLIEDSLSLARLVTHVIDYEDDFSWIKLTVDLTGTQQYILDPLSPTGAVFAKKVRENVSGLGSEEAQRIVNNYPEVKKAEISLWPPWSGDIPSIPSHIIIDPIRE